MSNWLWYGLVVAGLLVGVFALDRFLCWCELRGWIYYRLSPRQRRSLGAAAFQVEALLQPEKRHVYELRQDAHTYREEDDEGGGAPPDESQS